MQRVSEEASRVLVEREREVLFIVASMVVGGHVLIEGVPGIAKTLTARVVSKLFNLTFRRIQFTPDLLPADIIGTMVFNPKTGEFVVRKGPIFTNILLADEINRASPRTQSALLEAMQERQVTIEGVSYRLPDPFIVLATQNPIEMEGTFPLPEAQLDRFLIKLIVEKPSSKGLRKLITSIDRIEEELEELKPVASAKDIFSAREAVRRVYVDESIVDYIASIVEETHKHPAIRLGASPRAGIAMYKLARVWALMDGRDYVIPDDVKAVAVPVLIHRILLKPEYEFEGYAPARIVREILQRVPVPKP
ncbi:MAG: magnesium chelatase [Thermoprotei archaeon]|nr:MAG: magnesium chelatase [Thermoprotei archaeon]